MCQFSLVYSKCTTIKNVSRNVSRKFVDWYWEKYHKIFIKKVLTSVHKICLILFVLPNISGLKNDSIQAFKNFFSGELLRETTFFYNHLRSGDALYRWPLWLGTVHTVRILWHTEGLKTPMILLVLHCTALYCSSSTPTTPACEAKIFQAPWG